VTLKNPAPAAGIHTVTEKYLVSGMLIKHTEPKKHKKSPLPSGNGLCDLFCIVFKYYTPVSCPLRIRTTATGATIMAIVRAKTGFKLFIHFKYILKYRKSKEENFIKALDKNSMPYFLPEKS
jgi:hypothetical protein